MSTVSSVPKPGDVIGGKYRVERLLGSGGMGAVFEVSHHVTARRFALKWLLPDASAADGGSARFVREAQVAGRFSHPNVVEVFDIGPEGSSMFMIMELLEGESLLQRLTRVTRLSPEQARELIVPCMEGVAAAHAAGIIHRDLKPANIFICKARPGHAELPKVLDFGISKLSSLSGLPETALTTSATVIGTPNYMAPEQMRAQRLDHRVDVYAFGVMLYEMLSGARPFDADTYADLVVQVMTETPKPLDRLVDVSPGLAAAVARALARKPEERFDSLDEFVRALRSDATTGSRAGVAKLRSEETSNHDAKRFASPIGAAIAGAVLALTAVMVHSTVVRAPRKAVETQLSPISEPTRPDPEEPRPSTKLLAAEEATPAAGAGVAHERSTPAPPPSAAGPVAPRVAPTLPAAERELPKDPAPPAPPPTPAVDSTQLVRAAQKQFLQGHLAAARDLYAQATQADPKNDSAWRGLGLANERLGRTSEAILALRQAIRLAPEGAGAEMLRARLKALGASAAD